jgi:membrane protein YqaA with SNARE-associated domain
MEQEIAAWGLPALFAMSFLAATVLPVGSEWLLAVLLLQGGDAVPAVAVASIGNFLGACTTFYVGSKGRAWLEARGKFPEPRFYEKAEGLFIHYGTWALLLTWLPLLGDVLCLVAGVFGVGFLRFSAFTLTGKAGRYVVVAFLVL